MKKYALIILICICFALTFSSCTAKEQTVSFTQEVSEISSICVYNVQGSYDFENVGDLYDEDAPLHTIDKENYEEFLNAVGGLTFHKKLIPTSLIAGGTNIGYVIVISYENGGYDIISEHATVYCIVAEDGTTNNDIKFLSYAGDTTWEDFIKGYIA